LPFLGHYLGVQRRSAQLQLQGQLRHTNISPGVRTARHAPCAMRHAPCACEAIPKFELLRQANFPHNSYMTLPAKWSTNSEARDTFAFACRASATLTTPAKGGQNSKPRESIAAVNQPPHL